MYEMEYEWFVRRAFSMRLGNSVDGRKGDPAGLADADYIRRFPIVYAKVGTSYAIACYLDQLHDQYGIKENFLTILGNTGEVFLNRTLAVNTSEELLQLISEFKARYKDIKESLDGAE